MTRLSSGASNVAPPAPVPPRIPRPRPTRLPRTYSAASSTRSADQRGRRRRASPRGSASSSIRSAWRRQRPVSDRRAASHRPPFAPRNGRGERGGYNLLKGRIKSWVNPRFFFAGTALYFKSEIRQWIYYRPPCFMRERLISCKNVVTAAS